MGGPSGDGCEQVIFSLLSYDADTGQFRWRERASSRKEAGSLAGGITTQGYVRIKVAGKNRFAHRLAWLLYYGEWPKQQIDHINGIRTDNRICNLRDVAPRVNSQNQRRAHPKNTTGYLGVSRAKNGFNALIRDHEGVMRYLGKFQTPEAAHLAYVKAKAALHVGSVL